LFIDGKVYCILYKPFMQTHEVEMEAEELARKLGVNRSGGFIAMVFKWERIKLPIENVIASLNGFNKYRIFK